MVLHNDMIELACKACGLRSPVDMGHKITAFILKNPPPSDTPKKVKSSKSVKPKKAKSNGDDNGADQDEAKPKSRSKKSKGGEEDEDDDDVVWHTDTSAEAAAERRRQMIDNAGELAAKLLISPEKKGTDPVEKLANFITTGKPTNEQTIDEIQKTKDQEKWDDETTAKIVFDLLFNKDILAQLNSPKLDVLKKFVVGNKGQEGVLGAIVELCGVREASLIKSVPNVLKTLYDLDVLDEEAIVSWARSKAASANGNGAGGSGGAATKVKASAAVFVTWLTTAEEESDDD